MAEMSNVVKALRIERAKLAAELAYVDRALAVLAGTKKRTATRSAPAKRKLSRAGREAIAKAARKRWAAFRKANRKAGK